jgi:transcriptional regulator with XRE-family HTH domain
MNAEQAHRLATLLASKRGAAGLSPGEVARRAGIDKGTIWRIERAKIASPKARTLQAIGEVLSIPSSELFEIAPWVTPDELPTIRPYLRTKYRQLPPEAMQEIEAHFADLAKRYNIRFDTNDGPQDGEDE